MCQECRECGQLNSCSSHCWFICDTVFVSLLQSLDVQLWQYCLRTLNKGQRWCLDFGDYYFLQAIWDQTYDQFWGHSSEESVAFRFQTIFWPYKMDSVVFFIEFWPLLVLTVYDTTVTSCIVLWIWLHKIGYAVAVFIDLSPY